MSNSNNRKPLMNFVIPFLVAYVGSKIIFGLLGFNYDPVQEPLNVAKLFLDFGVFIVLFLAGSFFWRKIGYRGRKST